MKPDAETDLRSYLASFFCDLRQIVQRKRTRSEFRLLADEAEKQIRFRLAALAEGGPSRKERTMVEKKTTPTVRDSVFTLPDSKGKIHIPQQAAKGIVVRIYDGNVLMQIPLDGAGTVQVLIAGQGAKDLGAQLIRLGLQLVGPTMKGGSS